HNGFKGEETASRAPYKQNAALLKGRDYDMYDDENLCAVARFCERGNSVWNYIEEGGEEANKIAIEEACACPSGRLTVVDKKGKVIEPKLEQGISATQDPAKNVRGPLWVKGGIEIEGADGATYEVRNRVTLCRCGESSNMPFCDATHLNCPHMKGQDK
ncbi:MAG: CDGSH iron-sulfur domain-containing protein, partial [Elusimicrobiota bacterium]|nr:CDGSH iron-sulfur domain-containing protein [Elusimicrobiota bacterium]